MAAARPVLASNVCENPILINNRGMLFDPNSAISIADCIASFQAKTPNEKIEIGANCREFAMTNFTQLAFVNAYNKILSEHSTK